MTLPEPSTIKDTLSWLKLHGYSIPVSLRVKSIKLHLLSSREMKQEDYSGIRDTLWIAVYDAIYDYLNSSSNVTSFRESMVMAVSQAYLSTSEIAYEDGGGSLPLDEDTASQAQADLQAQLGFVDSLFVSLKALRKEGEFDANSEAADTADRWSSGLDGFYNSIKAAGAGNKMLTWRLGSTEKHCDTCLSLDGQRHRASWFISHNYIPRKPGSSTDCGGFHCDCGAEDDDGEDFFI